MSEARWPAAWPLLADLRGRVVVVMGAGAAGEGVGNGRACALAYARAGAQVVCVDQMAERAEVTAGMILADGGSSLALGADATRGADVEAVVSEALARFGRLDVMHSNVGVGGAPGDVTAITGEAWDREMAVNAKSAFLGVKYAVPAMERSGGGVITNVSSTLAVRFMRRPSVAYSAAKAAVEALTLACSEHYGPRGIRVNAIRIGFSETPLILAGLEARVSDPQEREQALDRSRAKTPMKRHGSPWDVAAAALYLAGDAANYVSGVILDVDGALKNAPF